MTDIATGATEPLETTPPPVEPPPPVKDPAVRRWRLAFVVALVAVVALIGTQVVIIQELRTTRDELAAIGDEIAAVDSSVDGVGDEVAGLQGEVAGVGERITSLEEQRLALAPGPQSETPAEGSAAPPSVEPTPGVTVVAASLPRFQGNSNTDPALGMTLGEVTGVEYYTSEIVTWGPDDGIARAVMVWAHWCPYCQQEIPEVSAWVEANQAAHPNLEIVSVTTAIDENGPNPLLPYLDDNQWPFPVLVDDDGRLAAQLGVNAFPFWLFLGPDGTVLGRTAGDLPLAQLESIFAQLQDIGASA